MMNNSKNNILTINSQLDTNKMIPKKKLIRDKINRMKNDKKIFDQFGSFLK